MNQRMNSEMLLVASNAGKGFDMSGLDQLVQHPNAFLLPATRDIIGPELVAIFQSMLAHALHSIFVVGTIVSVLALLLVALMPSICLTRLVER